ncbi:high mobility group box domain-containing protein [Pectobacterium versatile]|uniref:High mobility group box domain-containing protein n=2 Tax=Pectobacterium versatile TaxID=2488639 RepID=A0AAW3RVU8_9GAMM|nr:high mobility group box domain-containing protein [Pectobacterium versatile]
MTEKKMQHTTFHKKINFNKIIILDCLPENDYQTARHLHEKLSDKGFGSGICLLKVQDEKTFRDILQDIREMFNPELSIGFQPIIHIEAHGNPLSMELPDKSTISWNDLADDFRIINKLMGNQLITFVGTCHGYHFIYNNHTIKEFAPVYFCMAPLETISAGDIENSAIAFYESLFSTGNLTLSANLLDSSTFYTYNSDYMFHRAFHETMQKNHRGKALSLRREALITEAIKIMGENWKKMSPKDKRDYLKNARKLLDVSLKSKESLRTEFEKFSISYMGYINEDAFEEIWKHMNHNKQGKLY